MKADPTAAPALAEPIHDPIGARTLLGALLRGSSDRNRAGRDAILAFLVRAVSAALLYLSQVILARWMGSFEYGVYVFVWTSVLMLGGVSTLGFGMTMIRLLPTYRERGERHLFDGLLRAGRLIPLAAATLIAGLGLLAIWLAGERLSGPYVLSAFIVLFCLPLFTLSEVHDGIGRGSGWLAAGLLPHYVIRPLLVLACMGLARLSGLAMDAKTAAGAAVVATWLAAVLQLALIERKLADEPRADVRRYDIAGWFRIALPLLVIATCELVLQNADLLIVSRYLSPSDVAIYFAAAKTMSLILFVHYAVGSAVANRYAALDVRGDRQALEGLVRDAVNWTFWPSLLGAGLLLALGKPLLWLFGPQFTSGYAVMAILALGFLARSIVGPAEFLLNMLGEQRRCALILVLAAVVDIALGLLLVPSLGLIGGAIATSTALVAAAFAQWLSARRRLGLRIAIWENLRARP
ncbi:MAG TPA: lipopolysaccharide biosynthesis protein [Hyphomicrobiaceae bacterium]|nr:lipopolysaccharide biosynthesis protein [Hyphomicrobiaceae bacterium]